MQEKTDFVYTRRETADRLRISLRTLTRLERDRKIKPRVRLSDRRFGYKASTIEQYLSAESA
jgi:predicted site-specific integrase-resolvase